MRPIIRDNFVEDVSHDFCFTIKAQTQSLLNHLEKWPDALVSSEEVFKEGISDVFICKVNVLKFLKITEENFKEYLEGKKRFTRFATMFSKKIL